MTFCNRLMGCAALLFTIHAALARNAISAMLAVAWAILAVGWRESS